MAQAGIAVNLVLMALNLIPIPPLDGGRIAVSLLPARASALWRRLEPWGLPIILVLLMTGLLNSLMTPLLRAGEYLLQSLLQL
jgi:Zn-dependent protease